MNTLALMHVRLLLRIGSPPRPFVSPQKSCTQGATCRILYLNAKTGSSRRGKAGPMQVAQPILLGLHELTVFLSIALGFVVAGTVGYFFYAANMKLEP